MASLEEGSRARGLRVVGVHSPEFDVEKDPAQVRTAIRELGIAHPVVLDNELKMWDALDNRYWPTLYLVDRRGRIRGTLVGETHAGSPEAARFEKLLQDLLDEPAVAPGAPRHAAGAP